MSAGSAAGTRPEAFLQCVRRLNLSPAMLDCFVAERAIAFHRLGEKPTRDEIRCMIPLVRAKFGSPEAQRSMRILTNIMTAAERATEAKYARARAHPSYQFELARGRKSRSKRHANEKAAKLNVELQAAETLRSEKAHRIELDAQHAAQAGKPHLLQRK